MATVQMDQVLADQMLEQAVVFCAEKKFNGDSQAARLALRQGQCDACRYLSNSLVSQVSNYLGQMDRTVKAVYEFEIEHSSLRPNLKDKAAAYRKTGLNLVAWVDRKSPVLNTLGATLETLLSESRGKLGCKNATPTCYTLNLQMVDDKDVQERRGYGVIVNSVYVQSKQVWARTDVSAQIAPAPSIDRESLTPLDPEFAPEELLFDQALAIEKIPQDERVFFDDRLREFRLNLIRKIISDQLAYIQIAKEWFTIADLIDIRRRKIGYGKIGGKAAGMLLATRILKGLAEENITAHLRIPESYFIGSDVMYIFMAMNGLMHRNDQKYKSEDQIRAEYSQICEEFQDGEFPPEVLAEFRALLDKIGPNPIIVRSSSQLEDNFGTSFAGKYNSYFCPNQGGTEENLRALTKAIARTYASTLKPEALLYRRSRGLQDYDERMAILLQVVQGERFGKYFLPCGSGVAFSRNIYRWSPEIRREAGFARLVWGLGTRAVERVGNDYPRMVALSHPTLVPDDTCEAIRHYSQQYVDIIDLEENTVKILPVHEVLTPDYPLLRLITQIEQDGFFTTPRSRVYEDEIPKLAITYDELLRKTQFATILSRIMRLLEEHYHAEVDIEFTIHVPNPNVMKPDVQISLLQCRPQSRFQTAQSIQLPKDLPHENIIFSSRFIVPPGHLPNLRHVIFIPPEKYFTLPNAAARSELGKAVARLNAALDPKTFICVGPGRWGTTNLDLGVYVSYADICNAGALVELTGKGVGAAPEPSLGTHFFQDLMEAQIYPVAVCLDDKETILNRDFFYNTPNCLPDWGDTDKSLVDCLRLIEVASYRPGHHLELVMDDEKGQSTAFLAPD